MTWLSRLFGKSRPEPAAAELVPGRAPEAQVQPPAEPAAPEPTPERGPEPAPARQAPQPEPAAPADLEAEPETEEDDPEEPEDAADPTIGRYEPLDETPLDDAALLALRTEAERLALSGPHKVGPSDPAGPGSLFETLMRLEGEGRVASRVCDDADSGFYILYEPVQG